MALTGRVSIAFGANTLDPDPVWTVIDSLCSVTRIEIRDGRQTEHDETEAGTCTVYLIDKDGTFDPEGGPYAGILDGVPIAIALWNPVDEEWVPQWRGTIDDWYHVIDPTTPQGIPIKADVKIEAVGVFDYLARAEMSVGVDGDPAPPQSVGSIFYEDGEVNDRCIALLDDAKIDPDMYVVFDMNVDVLESLYDSGDDFLQALREAVDAEQPFLGNIYEDKLGRVVIHGRLARLTPDEVAADAGAAWDFRRWKAAGGALSRPIYSWTGEADVLDLGIGDIVWSPVLTRFLAVGNGEYNGPIAAESADGVTWTPLSGADPNLDYFNARRVEWAGGSVAKFVGAAPNYLIPAVLFSYGGTTLDALTTPWDTSVQPVDALGWGEAPGLLLAGGDGDWDVNKSLMKTADLSSWTEIALPRDSDPVKPRIRGIAYSDPLGIWLIVGRKAPSFSDEALAYTSPDTATWTEQDVTAAGAQTLTCCCWSDVANGFLAGTESGGILFSPDGVTWTRVASLASTAVSDIFDANGQVVAYSPGTVQTSPDGLSWGRNTTTLGTGSGGGGAYSPTLALVAVGGDNADSGDVGTTINTAAVSSLADPHDVAQIRLFAYGRPRALLINTATAYPRDIAEEDIVDQVFKDDTSRGRYGIHAKSYPGLIVKRHKTNGDSGAVQCQKYASFLINYYATPKRRIEVVQFRSMDTSDVRAPATWALLTGVSISDLVNLTVPYRGGTGVVGEDHFVEGRQLTIEPLRPEYDNVTLELNLSPFVQDIYNILVPV